MVELRKATQADVERYFEGKKPPFSMKGYAVIEDDEVIAVCGVYRAGKQFYVFVDAKEALQKYPKAFVKGARLMESIIQQHVVVSAYVNADSAKSIRYAERFGFEDTGTEFEGKKVMIRWNR
jgi:L-amino acid N-acyltransferase YncA